MGYLLGIDIGTTGVKTILVDERGETVSRATIPHPLYTPYSHWSEQHPEDWWEGTVSSIRRVLSEAGVNDSSSVMGVGLSGQMHSAVFLDAEDHVIRPAILWNDGRTTKQCQWITERAGRTNLERWVANPALEGFTAPKVIWLRDHEPENSSKLRTLLLPKDYIRFRLTGEKAMEVSDAAGTLLFDVRNRRWSSELLDCLGLPETILPPVYESVEVCGRITPAVAELTGLHAGTPVVGGGADNTCGATGTGIVKEGRVLSSIGTSGVVFAHSDDVKVDPKMRVHSFCHSIPHRWYLMGVTLSAGNSFRWFRDTLGLAERQMEELTGIDAYALLTQEAERVEAGSEGLIFLPYLTGERTPHQDANARGVFFGLTGRHGRGHLIRAVLEGITYAMRDSFEIMRELGLRVDEIRATGGGAKSPFWLQLQADVYGAPVVTVDATEGPAFGAALMAAVGVGLFSDLVTAAETLVRVTSAAEPDEGRMAIYHDYYQVFRELYPRLKESFKAVSTIITKQRQDQC
ncbi:MAG: xylulokinase [Candidatus Latescibacteria bacterium]|nr:xylulokinase [Candidatus Latescibacterota bacterium]